jgi:hypothetical protein
MENMERFEITERARQHSKTAINTGAETHFQRAEAITYDPLAIANEKLKTIIQEKDKEIETLKKDFRTIQLFINMIDLSPATKEVNGMDTFKENKKE